MKRRVVAVVGITIAAASVLFGPDLLDLYRLDRHIQAKARDYEFERGPWPQVSDTCTGCHGVNGSPLNQHYPALAAQPPTYLAAQLRAYGSGARVHPIMNAMARSLETDDVGSVAAFFARQMAVENHAFKPDGALLQQGRQIAMTSACAACHGQTLMGSDHVPRIAGLGYDYLLKQLDGFSSGARRDPTQVMNTLASAWPPEQRKAVAAFLASHPVARVNHQAK